MRVFFDPSAFAKRYLQEQGSEQVLQWCDEATELALSVVAVAELISAFCRLRREAKITAAQYTRLKRQLLADIGDALICDTTPAALGVAVRALESHVLRGMDAIHRRRSGLRRPGLHYGRQATGCCCAVFGLAGDAGAVSLKSGGLCRRERITPSCS